jgi:hypothetical protein
MSLLAAGDPQRGRNRDLPDSVAAGALTTAITKTGAFKCVEAYELLTQDQLVETLDLARDAAQVYEAPGQPV